MPTMNEEKASIIAQALMTDDGRTALAHAMVIPISDSLELFGMSDVMREPTREIALVCLSRYEKNIANGKVYTDYIVKAINKIYAQWDIERGNAKNILDEVKRITEEEKIDNRFDILDL